MIKKCPAIKTFAIKKRQKLHNAFFLHQTSGQVDSSILSIHVEKLRAGVLNLYFLIYPLENFKGKIYSLIFFVISLLQMSIVVGESVNFLLSKFTPKAGQIYPQGVNLLPVENFWLTAIEKLRLQNLLWCCSALRDALNGNFQR